MADYNELHDDSRTVTEEEIESLDNYEAQVEALES
jgi:hypothetical protein